MSSWEISYKMRSDICEQDVAYTLIIFHNGHADQSIILLTEPHS